jgi:hypothetical protein
MKVSSRRRSLTAHFSMRRLCRQRGADDAGTSRRCSVRNSSLGPPRHLPMLVWGDVERRAAAKFSRFRQWRHEGGPDDLPEVAQERSVETRISDPPNFAGAGAGVEDPRPRPDIPADRPQSRPSVLRVADGGPDSSDRLLLDVDQTGVSTVSPAATSAHAHRAGGCEDGRPTVRRRSQC